MLFPTPLFKQKGIQVTNFGDVMDTLYLHAEKINSKKITETIINVSLIGALVLCQGLVPIHADSVKVARVTAPDFDISNIKEKILNEISTEKKIENFDKLIYSKYPNSTIYNIKDGVKHIKLTRFYNNKPVKINVVEIDFNIAKNLKIIPALADKDNLNSKKHISKIAKENNALIALNGTYFKPQTGVPLGTLMINKKLQTGPIYNRVALAISKNNFEVARVQLNAKITSKNTYIKIDNINQPRMLSTYTLAYTPQWGKYSPKAPKYGTSFAISNGNIIQISTNPLEIPTDGFVISGPQKELEKLLNEKDLKLNIETNPNWEHVDHIISGGPYLIKNDEVFVDMTAQKLGAIGGKNPRSAIGYTKENNLILVAIDGREGNSIGMTLMELAKFMRSIGCVNAINLDGGGSTVMYIEGKIVNNPQNKNGIPISNAVLITN